MTFSSLSMSHLPEWFQVAAQSDQPIKIEFDGAGYAWIVPDRKLCVSDIRNWADARIWGPNVQWRGFNGAISSVDATPLGQLYWALTEIHVRRQQQEGISLDFKFSLLTLDRWPALTDLAVALVPQVARVCALLERKPTTVALVPKVLQANREEVYRIIEMLRLAGCVLLSADLAEQARLAAEDAPQETGDLHETVSQRLADTMLGKLWQRLMRPA